MEAEVGADAEVQVETGAEAGAGAEVNLEMETVFSGGGGDK